MGVPKKLSQEEIEDAIVEGMSKARAIANTLFGEQSNLFAVKEIYEYLEATDDEEDFAKDLKRIIDKAKLVFETETPTPEQVFFLFSTIFPSE